ncbi:MAG: DUF4878 domain-containing protein [Bacteroides sp.]|nr:DUF4878 domain-containing protein [Bacteroides sp.]
MKKLIHFAFLATVVLTLAACSAGSPGEAAKKYANYLKSGNYEKFAEGIAMSDDVSAEEARQGRQMLAAMMQEKGKMAIDQKGGIDKIDIVSEEIAADGETAKVVLKLTFKNGDDEEMTYNMVKQKSDWKIDMSGK